MIKIIMYLLSSITVLAAAIISPAMGEIYRFFEGENSTLVKLIVTTSSFFVIPASFLSLVLAKRFGKKKVLLGALALYGVGGCCGAFLSELNLMLLSRAMLGVGVGVLMPISQSLPAYFFTGAERATVITRQSASIALGNFICVLFAGWLTLISWRLAFFVYAIAFPILLIVLIYLPEIEDKKNPAETSTQTSHSDPSSEKLPMKSFFIALCMFFLMVAMYAFYTNVAILVQMRELGSAAHASYALALGSITSFITSFNVHRLKKFWGRFFIPNVCFVMTVGYIIVYFADNIFMIAIGGIFASYTMGSIMPTSMVAMTNSVPKELVMKAMAVMTTSMFLGQFLSPIIFNLLPAFPNYTEYGSSFLTLSTLFFLAGIGSACYIFSRKEENN